MFNISSPFAYKKGRKVHALTGVKRKEGNRWYQTYCGTWMASSGIPGTVSDVNCDKCIGKLDMTLHV